MKKSFQIVVLFLLAGGFAIAQNDQVYTIVPFMPQFKGGTDMLAAYLETNTQYPAEAREQGFSGKTYVNFVVDTSGKVLSPTIIKSSGNKSIDNEALRVVGSMPNWDPGRDSIRKVNVALNLPVIFKSKGFVLPSPNGNMSAAQIQTHEEAMEYWQSGHKLELDGKYNNALEKYNRCLAIEPTNKFAMFDKGKMLVYFGEKEKAREIWTKMVQSNVRKDEAEEFIRKYCDGNDGAKEIAGFLGKARAIDFFDAGMKELNNGRYEAALKRFDSCLKYNHEHKNALYNKGLMHFKLDQKRAACTSWKELYAIAPDDKEIEGILKKYCN